MKIAVGLLAPVVTCWMVVSPPQQLQRSASAGGGDTRFLGWTDDSRAEGEQSRQSAGTPAYNDRFISVNGLRLHYLDWGTSGKQPLLILHESSGFAHSYDHIAPQFNHEYHVMAVDLRGHGDSAWSPNGAYLVEDYVKDIEAVVAQLKLRDVVLLGASLGGRVAQMYAGLHPERVARLIVEDVGPERGPEIKPQNLRMVEQQEKGWATEDDLLTYLKSRGQQSLYQTFIHYGTKRRADGRLMLKRDPNYVNTLVAGDVWPYVRRITCPTIYIVGAESTIVPPKTQQQLKDTAPNIEVVLIPAVAHYPHLEAPDKFTAIVKGFLARPITGHPEPE